AKDPRFLVGVNMDGTLFGTESSTLLNQPFLWLESDGGLASNYVHVRDQLLDGLQRGGALLIFAGSMHEGFTDGPAYFTAPGRLLIGSLTAGSLSLSDMTSMSGDTISAFVGPILNGPNGPTLEQVVAHYPAIKEARHIAVATPK